MAYDKELKEKILREVSEGQSVKDISQKYNISKSTIYNWKKIIKGARTLENRKFTGVKLIETQNSKKIKQLIREKDYKEAKRIGERFPDSEIIQSQMITIAIRENNLKEAKKAGERFPDYEAIQSQMIKRDTKQNNLKETKEGLILNKNIFKSILNQINSNPNDPTLFEKIKEMEDEWQKILLYFALCEKSKNKPLAEKFMKDLQKKS